MMPPRIVSGQGELSANSTEYRIAYTLDWQLMYGASNLDTALLIAAIEANLGAKVVIRTADVRSSAPNGWGTPGAERTTNDTHTESFDLSTETDCLFVQAAVLEGLTTGSTSKRAFSRLDASPRGAGWIVARQRHILRASSSDTVLAIGNPFPCAGVTGLMFGLVFKGVSGTIVSPTTVWRSFDSADPDKPNAWSTHVAGSNLTSDGSRNAAAAINTAGKLMAQGGIKYSTSGTNPYAELDVIIAAKM